MATPLRLFFLGFILSANTFALEHSTYINPTTRYEFKRFYHGVELSSEHTHAFDAIEAYAQPTWKQYHNGSFVSSGVLGIRYDGFEPIIGLNMGYDASTMAIAPMHQMSWGLELRDDVVELNIRHFRPWTIVKEVNGYEISTYYHTDVDILVKDDFYHWGFGFYETKIDLGVKAVLKTFYKAYGTCLEWKWDHKMKHCYAISLTWNFPVPGKKTFNNQSHFVYKEKTITKLAARPRLSLLETPLVVQEEPPLTSQIDHKMVYTVEIPENIQWPILEPEKPVNPPEEKGWVDWLLGK